MDSVKLAHSFRGRSFTSSELSSLLPTFRESYEKIIRNNSERLFLKAYEKEEIIQKSFFEFDRDVRRVASHLKKTGGENRTFVSIGRNTYRHLVYLTAALLRGMTLVPMNPADGIARISEKVSSLGAGVSVFSDEIEHGQSMKLDLEDPVGSENSRAFEPNQPFICVLTSGSTGYSKFVEQMEWNVLANVDSLITHHKLRSGAVLATSMPIFHVSALEFSFLGSLLSGSTLVLYWGFDLATVSQSLQQDSVQILSLIPTLLRVILDRREDFASLSEKSFKYVICGASALPKSLALEFMKSFLKPIVHGYGLSEAVQSCTSMPIDLPLTEYERWLTSFPHPSIGVELNGNEIHILDSENHPSPPNVEGEICVRGFNVMRSYRGMDPTDVLSEGFLKTGDLGYFVESSDGRRFYFISGRKKDVIKRYGETISLREIDDTLLPFLPEGLDAISVGFSHTLSGEEVGLVVKISDSGGEPDVDDLISRMNSIPLYMKPKVIAFTRDEIRTASGKPMRWSFVERFSHLHSTQLSAPFLL